MKILFLLVLLCSAYGYAGDVSISSIVDVILTLEGADNESIGKRGEIGTMQVMPMTWEEMNELYFRGKIPYNIFYLNEKAQFLIGRQYIIHLSSWLKRHRHRWKANYTFLLLSAYNGGMGNVSRYNFSKHQIRKNIPAVYRYATRGENLLE